ncbi:hypothetical protein L3Y34_003456 [Caenorhabditis briggsae]|uniref:T-box domain-containing protein n=1 Tax=Caenorhabditis briggsae TaxID=6238 RepID=A0AAE9A907_CAEBR|nr:hypothetical protein L3Y34_003456 [Caenorhabditis briggsae]
MNTITVRCTSEEEWKRRRRREGGEVDEDTVDVDSINHPNYATIILNKFPPENLKFEYEVTGLEEDSEYEMELLFDPSGNLQHRFQRRPDGSFHIINISEVEQLPVLQRIRHEKKQQTGSYWMKSKVNFDKVWFRNAKDDCRKPDRAKYVVDLASSRMYYVKLRIQKISGEEKILDIDHQYFVACARTLKPMQETKKEDKKKNKTDTNTLQPKDRTPRKRRSNEMMSSPSDNFQMSLFDQPAQRTFSRQSTTVNPIQLPQMNIDMRSIFGLFEATRNINFKNLLGGFAEPFLEQGPGQFLNSQPVNIEQGQRQMMPSTSDNFGMPLLDLPKPQALGALPSTVNPFQPQQMNSNLMSALQTFMATQNINPQMLQGAGQFSYPPPGNIEQGQPQMMPSTSDNFGMPRLDLPDLLEQQAFSAFPPPVNQETINSIWQALRSISNQPQAGQVLTVPPPVNIEQGQPQIVVNPVEEPPINPEPKQGSPRHLERN